MHFALYLPNKWNILSSQASTEIDGFLVSYCPLSSSQMRPQFHEDWVQLTTLETIVTSTAPAAWYYRTSENLPKPIPFHAPLFCFISSVRKFFSAEVHTEVKQNILLWYSVYMYFPFPSSEATHFINYMHSLLKTVQV